MYRTNIPIQHVSPIKEIHPMRNGMLYATNTNKQQKKEKCETSILWCLKRQAEMLSFLLFSNHIESVWKWPDFVFLVIVQCILFCCCLRLIRRAFSLIETHANPIYTIAQFRCIEFEVKSIRSYQQSASQQKKMQRNTVYFFSICIWNELKWHYLLRNALLLTELLCSNRWWKCPFLFFTSFSFNHFGFLPKRTMCVLCVFQTHKQGEYFILCWLAKQLKVIENSTRWQL